MAWGTSAPSVGLLVVGMFLIGGANQCLLLLFILSVVADTAGGTGKLQATNAVRMWLLSACSD